MSEQVSSTGPMYRPSQDDSRGIDPGTKRLLYIMGGVGLVLLTGLGVYSMFGHSGGELPVVQADNRPIREKPANPGGMVVAVQEKKADPNQSRLAPGVEEPNPSGLMANPDQAHPAAPVKPRAKTFSVQLSAAKSEAEAQALWDKMAKRMPDLVGAHRPMFQKTNEAGQTPWRLRTGGFTDSAQAKTFCDQVKAKGGKCVVLDS